MDVSTDPNNEHAQLQDTSHRRLQQGRMSGTGVPGERLMTKECSDTVAEDTTEAMPNCPDVDMSQFDIGYWDGLDAHRMLDTKDSADVEEETCVSEVVEITYDREDTQPSNIDIDEDTLADDMEVESIAVWTGLVERSQQHIGCY